MHRRPNATVMSRRRPLSKLLTLLLPNGGAHPRPLTGSAAVVVLAAVFTWLAPVVLAPAFNKFEPLEPGQARSDVLELGERAGVDIGEVYRVDASRRGTSRVARRMKA